jgi:hypothetical protein
LWTRRHPCRFATMATACAFGPTRTSPNTVHHSFHNHLVCGGQGAGTRGWRGGEAPRRGAKTAHAPTAPREGCHICGSCSLAGSKGLLTQLPCVRLTVLRCSRFLVSSQKRRPPALCPVRRCRALQMGRPVPARLRAVALHRAAQELRSAGRGVLRQHVGPGELWAEGRVPCGVENRVQGAGTAGGSLGGSPTRQRPMED